MEKGLGTLGTKRYLDLRNTIRSGDILLCSGQSLFSNMIKQATNSEWSHVGFILRLDVIDRIMILESVESIGVRTVPLSNYAVNYNGTGRGYDGKMLIARHRHFNEKNIKQLSKIATDFLGYPYNTQEIVRIATRLSLNSVGVSHLDSEKSSYPREFICSEYVHLCFDSIGIQIDFNPLGFIAPADFARCPDLDPISFVKSEGREFCIQQAQEELI